MHMLESSQARLRSTGLLPPQASASLLSASSEAGSRGGAPAGATRRAAAHAMSAAATAASRYARRGIPICDPGKATLRALAQPSQVLPDPPLLTLVSVTMAKRLGLRGWQCAGVRLPGQVPVPPRMIWPPGLPHPPGPGPEPAAPSRGHPQRLLVRHRRSACQPGARRPARRGPTTAAAAQRPRACSPRPRVPTRPGPASLAAFVRRRRRRGGRRWRPESGLA